MAMRYLEQRLRLFLQHQSALTNLAAPIVGCRSGAEDVVQEAYLRFASSNANKTEIHNPVAYLYQIVRRLAFDWVQSNGRERAGEVESDFFEATEAPAPSPEQSAADRQALAIVADALAELPERTRTAFMMHRIGGHKLHDIADTLGISVTLAHQLVHRALAHCASRIADE